jgi:EasF-like predicted methyltransferase
LDGLSQPHGCKTLPSLLLWGEKGQTLYDDVLATPEYYPYRIENELLQERMDEITSTIARSRPNLLVELGAGNMSKTGQFLTSLDKHLSAPLAYYALDVDRAQLERSLQQLKEKTNLRWIQLRALFGTYEDGASWLARPEIAPFRKSFVWLGTSIANYDQHKASQILASFSRDPQTGTPQSLAGFLLLIDGCQDAARIQLAYDVPSGESRRWIMQAITVAREHLRGGDDEEEVNRLLADENWRFEGQWHPERQRYENYLVPTRRLVGIIRGRLVQLEEGERVWLVGSGKWTRDTVSSVASKPGLEVRKAWHNVEFNYGESLNQACLISHRSNKTR